MELKRGIGCYPLTAMDPIGSNKKKDTIKKDTKEVQLDETDFDETVSKVDGINLKASNEGYIPPFSMTLSTYGYYKQDVCTSTYVATLSNGTVIFGPGSALNIFQLLQATPFFGYVCPSANLSFWAFIRIAGLIIDYIPVQTNFVTNSVLAPFAIAFDPANASNVVTPSTWNLSLANYKDQMVCSPILPNSMTVSEYNETVVSGLTSSVNGLYNCQTVRTNAVSIPGLLKIGNISGLLAGVSGLLGFVQIRMKVELFNPQY